jgi:YD repeat-containing protein
MQYSASSFAVTAPSGGDTTPPTTPTGLTSSAASSSQINLSWSASTDNVGVTGYIIQRCSGANCSDFAEIGTSTTTSYSDSGLTASTSYSYQVQATDAVGNLSGFSSPSTATTQASGGGNTPPTAPGGLSASATSSSQISLSWTASTDSTGVSGYLVERCQGAGCATFSQVGTSTSTGYTDAGLIPVTSYSYRVRAADAAGNISDYSSIASATTASGTNSYVYDSNGRLYSITNFSGTMYYHYDAAGNVTSITASP